MTTPTPAPPPAVTPTPVPGNYDITFTDTLLDTTSSCVSSPRRERAFGMETFLWNGGEYLIMSVGNELEIFSVGIHPKSIAKSHFNFGTVGDSDYDVMSFDVCDNCRYGVMDHKVAGVVVFDLGTGATPRFASFSRDGVLSLTSIVFKKGSQEYLLAKGRSSSCGQSSLYAVNGVNDLEWLQCPDIWVKGGEAVTTDTGTYLFLGGGLFADTELFKANGTADGMRLEHIATPDQMKSFHRSLSIDPNYMLLASADLQDRKVRFWDISNPTAPVLKPSWTLSTTAGYVSLRSASSDSQMVLATYAAGWLNSTRTYLVDPATGPQPIDNEFWTDTTEPHNAFQNCVLDQGIALSSDGSVLYLGRYSLGQVFNINW